MTDLFYLINYGRNGTICKMLSIMSASENKHDSDSIGKLHFLLLLTTDSSLWELKEGNENDEYIDLGYKTDTTAEN